MFKFRRSRPVEEVLPLVHIVDRNARENRGVKLAC